MPSSFRSSASRRLLAFFALLLLPALGARAQSTEPLYETRAVWFTTVARLDGWPSAIGQSASFQEQGLRERIRETQRFGINTFIFQAVSRGDAMYPSERLPWARWLKGAGEDPGYDPLAVAIDEAHRLGMEVHVWYNVFRVGDEGHTAHYEDASDPGHVFYEHPDWMGTPVRADEKSHHWVDPSNPEVREWLVGNVLEIVRNYDIDAIHFDYIRYPSGGLVGDGERYQANPRGFASIADWRRDNVTQFVKDAYAAILAEKPWVKVGSAPIGNYQSNGRWNSFYGYTDAFQESRRWVQEGYHDYLAPQLYFTIGTTPEGSGSNASPDFSVVIREWEAASVGRPIYAGIGAYKPAEGRFPASDLPLLIDDARAAGAEGQVYFRYQHLKQYAGLITSRYTHPALPVPMEHRFEASPPAAPADLQVERQGDLSVRLAWSPSAGAALDPLFGYAVFREEGEAPDANDGADLYALLGDVTSFTDTFDAPPDGPVFYRVVARSHLGKVSLPSPAVSTEGLALPSEAPAEAFAFRFRSIHPNPSSGEATIRYEVDDALRLSITVYDVLGREVARLDDRYHRPGGYSIRFAGEGLAGGMYLCVLQSGNRRATARFIMER